jgi:hypothetical protein
MTYIKPIAAFTEAGFAEVKQAAFDDGHASYGVTHVIEKNNEIIGHLSVGGIPTVLVWMHTKKANAFDTHRAMQFFQDELRLRHAKGLIVPCPVGTPLYAYMEKAGYEKPCPSDVTMFIF